MAASGRVIIHADLDCFYVQVEQKRLGIPRGIPAAVQQWDGLIAINYAARAAGITRHMRVKEAMAKCPELQCIHVQTLGGETGQEGIDGPVNAGLTHPNDRALQKACLERYRRASAEIMAVMRTIVPQAKIERASIDEMYIDVTSLVEKELSEREDAATSEHASIDAFAWGSIVEGGPLNTESECDRRLSVGASIACRIRGAVWEKLDFTVSAGIAGNKLLAKIGSGRNKPNQQTIVPPRGVAGLLENLPLRKLRNFGGKLGHELEAMGASTVGQVAVIPFQQLQQRFGDRATYIANCVRGISDEPVQVRELSKSMLAAKSFEATADMGALTRWLGILADELSERMTTDIQLNQRYPRLLVLSYRQKDSPAGRSRSGQMPRAPPPGPTAAALKDAAMAILQKCPDAIPCCNLGLTATEFQEVPGDEQGCITRFFVPRAQADKNADSGPAAAAPSFPERRFPEHARPRQPTNTIDRLFKKAATVQSSEADQQQQQQQQRKQQAAEQQRQSASPTPSRNADDGLETGFSRDAVCQDAQPSAHVAMEQRDVQEDPRQGAISKQRHAGCQDGARAADEGGRAKAEQQALEQQTPDQPGSSQRGIEGSDLTTAGEAADAVPTGGETATDGDERQGQQAALDPGLEGVDLEEQKRILHDIWVQSTVNRHASVGQKRKGGKRCEGPAASKQPRLTELFAKKKV